MTNDIDNIGQTLQQSLTQLITSLLTVIGVLIMMFTISPILAVISLLSVPLSIAVTVVIAGRSQKQFVAQWATTGTLNGHVEEMHSGPRHRQALRPPGRGDRALRRGERQAVRGELPGAVHQRHHPAGAELHRQPQLRRDRGHRRAACRVGPDVARRRHRVHLVLAPVHVPDHPDREHRQRPAVGRGIRRARLRAPRRGRGGRRSRSRRTCSPAARGAVAFEDVSFRYEPDKPLIEHLDLIADAGETVAIVGPTGAGKTTLVNLLMRFYDVDGGRITVDGIDTRELTRDDLRHTFGMVLQDTWLFHGTIRDNIAYGREGATEDEIVAAAEARPRRPLRADAARRLRHRHR